MKMYIGTKVIKSRAMNRGDYNEHRGWNIPENENPDDPGQLVGYPDEHSNFDGELEGGCHYISWSPADVFDAAYKPMTGMSFGLAIEAMKLGNKVARAGWNGKGMWIGIVTADNYSINIAPYDDGQDIPEIKSLLPWIGMKTADNKFVPWLASQTDMLAEDWTVV
jgi:hypothetical protein